MILSVIFLRCKHSDILSLLTQDKNDNIYYIIVEKGITYLLGRDGNPNPQFWAQILRTLVKKNLNRNMLKICK